MTTKRIPIEIPATPTERQADFLASDELEVFFGGAAGGGKSAALLMAALQYVDQPGYSALIIRKDLPRLGLAGGLIPRSHEWLAGNKEATWNQSRYQWQFPTEDGPPATLTFGYLARPLDKYRYSSSEFQYIAFDELTDFQEDDYLFLFSRLRRNKSVDVPLRIRSASNPGGIGHLWVKQRFISPDCQRSEVGSQNLQSPILTSDLRPLTSSSSRRFIPSRIADNPHLNEAEYRQTLMNLPTVVRERLMNGDWSVQESALIEAKWLRYYIENDGQLELLEPDGRIFATLTDGISYRFVTIDPAGTSQDRTQEAKGRASWTVMQVWDQPSLSNGRYLILRHQFRERVGFQDLVRQIRHIHETWHPWQIWIENEKLGQAAIDELQATLPIRGIATASQDKATRAGKLILKMENGEVLFPKHNSTWRPALEAEFLSWTGHERETADQIDAAAYAAIVAGDSVGKVIQLCMPLAL